MAIINSPLGTLKGKRKDLVFCSRYGRTYIRQRPEHYRDSKTEAQLLQRSRFRQVSMFYRIIKGTLFSEAWKIAAEGLHKSGYNLFTGTNINACGAGPREFDFRKFHFCRGKLQLPAHLTCTCGPDRHILLEWEEGIEQATCRPGDRIGLAMLYMSPADPDDIGYDFCFPGELLVCRKDKRLDIRVPEGVPDPFHLYVYFVSEREDCFSDDCYFYIASE